MRVGRIIRVRLNGLNHLGVVKSYNPEGLTAVFPHVGPSQTVELKQVDFTKADKPHSLANHDFTDLGTLLRQLTGIAKAEDKPKPEHDTHDDVLGAVMQEDLEADEGQTFQESLDGNQQHLDEMKDQEAEEQN